MKAMVLEHTAPIAEQPNPLRMTEVLDPEPASHELLIEVTACGVCHTELDEIEGRLATAKMPIIPGHEVVGRVAKRGESVAMYRVGDRVGVGWIHHSDGQPDENLSPAFCATGCDVDGGYAQYMTVPARYAVAIPESLSDTEAAPLLCAGAIGYRALALCNLSDGQPLGLMGFGASGHLTLPLAKHLYPGAPVFVFVRGESTQAFARQLGADWSGPIDATAPLPCHAIIDTTPAWWPVVQSLRHLAPGGRLVINAIRKEETDKKTLLELDYHRDLWMEREVKSVANLTHRDITQFMRVAGTIPLRPTVRVFQLQDANAALRDLRQGNMQGANVLSVA
ncbi:MAG: alcohol dehydrogenase catalytic domain-containing protein [Planctomycetota bacterium]